MEEGCSTTMHTEEDESLCSESAESEIEQASGGSISMVPLLDQLKCPTASDLARKRKIVTNPPQKLKRSKGAVAAEPKKILPRTRITEFPSQHFSEKLGKLFCDACREILFLKKSMIIQHIKSAKHAHGLKHLASRSAKHKNVLDMLKIYDKACASQWGKITRSCAN